MANSWPTVSIDDIKASSKASIAIGPFGSRLKADSYIPSGVPVIRGNNLNGARFLTNEFVYVSDEKADELKSSIVYADDLVFPHRGNIGSVGLVPNDQPRYLLSTSLMKLSVNKTLVDPTFLFYYFTSETGRHELLKNASQAGTPGIATPLSSLKSIKFQLPPLDEQRRIAHILGTLDDKIELNRQLNATLEQLARTLFQSWFVDFDPVRAKASGEPEESICRRLGLTPELLALFPAALKDSAIGEIPVGWEVKSLDGIATFLNGVAAQKYPPQGKDDLPVIKIAQLRKGNTEGADVADASTVPTAYIVENGDVLFSWSGSLEVEIWGGGLGILNQHLFKVESEHFPKWFYFMWTRHHLPSFRLTAADKATTMGHIQRKHLTNAKVLVPPAVLLEKMTVKFSPFLAQAEDFAQESRTLATLRDELLPQLLSGELRVSESTYGASKASL